MRQIGSLTGEERAQFAAGFVGRNVTITHAYIDSPQRGYVVAVAAMVGGHTDYVLVLRREDNRVLAFSLATLRRIDGVKDEIEP
jgi:hypothetical protein